MTLGGHAISRKPGRRGAMTHAFGTRTGEPRIPNVSFPIYGLGELTAPGRDVREVLIPGVDRGASARACPAPSPIRLNAG